MTSVAWNSALDRIEAELAAIDEAITKGLPVPAQSADDFPTEPMPADLGPRAEALLQRTRRLESLAAEELDGIGDALRALAGRRPPAPANTGQIVDVGA